MITKRAIASAIAVFTFSTPVIAQEEPQKPQITMGNGEVNAIQIEGLTRKAETATFSGVQVSGSDIASFRANTTAITFPEVTIENAGWLVLHPVIDGRPNGDMVSGFTYLDDGRNEEVTIQIDHPADPGDKFLVMLHSDADQDGVFDFVFVEDGINVEDTAVFEGTHMIAHIFEVPE
ncbi:MAG: hypothetical protein AAFV54_15680 [Pseudomonadota bacterium]